VSIPPAGSDRTTAINALDLRMTHGLASSSERCGAGQPADAAPPPVNREL